MSADDRRAVLAEAERCVCVDRANAYGPPEDSLGAIAALWNAAFGTEFDARGVVLAMALVKIARLKANPGHYDSWVDLAGYAACGGGMIDGQTEVAGRQDTRGGEESQDPSARQS